jgi:hypothetical protein
MLDTRSHVVEDAISDLAIGQTDVRGVSPFGYMAPLVLAAEFATPESATFIVQHTSGLRPVAAMSELVGVRYPHSMPDSLQGAEFGHAHRRTVVDPRDRIAFRSTVTTTPVESAQARGRAGVTR